MSLRETLGEQVSSFMFRDFAQVAALDSVTTAAKRMHDLGATEAFVVSEGAPIGIVTERDILYKVVAAGSNPASVKVHDIMSSPVATIEDTSRVGEAIAKMSKLGIRRLGVTKNGKIIGMITQKAMVSGNLQQSVPLPELAPPGGFTCPYCSAIFKSGEELSKHIDRTHIGGLGLLQGDLSKW
jgi:signal-transduction protein with cAMP-binding, CBS, and nucleotidyltransferase domain